MENSKKKSGKILLMVQLAIFTAIEIIFCFTPLGSLPIGPLVATLAHLPALVCAITLGKWAGLYMGGVMGICSLIWWTFFPGVSAVSAFAFTPFAPNGNIWSLIICIVPRALFPFIASLLFDFFKGKIKAVGAATVSAGISTFLHSFMVLGLIYLCFNGNEVIGTDYLAFVIAWAGWNALLEIGVAMATCAALVIPLLSIQRINKNS